MVLLCSLQRFQDYFFFFFFALCRSVLFFFFVLLLLWLFPCRFCFKPNIKQECEEYVLATALSHFSCPQCCVKTCLFFFWSFFFPLCKCITFLWGAEGYFHVELDESMHFFFLRNFTCWHGWVLPIVYTECCLAMQDAASVLWPFVRCYSVRGKLCAGSQLWVWPVERGLL